MVSKLTVITELREGWEVKSEIVLKSHQTKGRQAQTVDLPTSLMKEIGDYYKAVRLDLDLADSLISSQKKGSFSSQTIQNLFRVLYQAAGIDNASSHSGRRTFITQLSERGVSVRIIQALARHSSLQTTALYIDVSQDKLRKAVEGLAI